ncbi:MAG: 6-carboxytetrahydropterin synthase [Planctomycetota bacterium]
MPVTVSRAIDFCAGHRLLGHEGKCTGLHGHNYVAEVTIAAEELDAVGRVVDFAVIKSVVKGWIDTHWDHGILLNRTDEGAIAALRLVAETKLFLCDGNPTVEWMAAHLCNTALPPLLEPYGVTITRVKLSETPNCFATAVPGG